MNPDSAKAKNDVLGKLLVAQQTVDLLPNERVIGEFVSRALLAVPGVAKAHVCLSAAPASVRADFEPACRTCEVRLGDPTAASAPGCAIAATAAGYRVFPLRTARGIHGYVPIGTGNGRAFARHEPYAQNFIGVVARAIESRRYQARLTRTNDELIQVRESLERTVATRTAELTESEEKYRLMFSTSIDAMALIDAETWRFLDVNPAWVALYGHTREETLALALPDVTADPQLVATALGEAVAAGQARRAPPGWHKSKGGERFPVEMGGDRLELQGKRAILLVVRDMSERWKAEQELRAERDFSRAAVDSIFGIFYLIDENGKFRLWNRNFETVSECSAEEIRRKQPTDFVPSSERELISERMRQCFREGRADVEATLVSKSGRRIPFHFNGLRIEFEGIPCLIGMGIDISKRKEAESAAYLAANALENTADGVMITGLDGRILTVNKGFTAITGYSAEEALGQTPRLLRSGRHEEAFYRWMWEAIQADGNWQGEVWNRRKNGEIYPELLSISAVKDAAGEITHYIGVFNNLSMHKAYEERLQFLSTHDPLTQLPNRVLFQDRCEAALARSRRQGNHCAVLYLDIDRFQHVNDSLGHGAGDRLLQEISRRLKECVRGSDTVARFAADEFVILAEELGDVANAAAIAQQIVERVSARPFIVDGRELFVTASIGISCFPRDGDDVESLLRNADVAVFRVKDSGGCAFQFYAEEMTVKARDRLAMENGLRQAINRNELVLHYQPRADLASGRITGVEALVRWQHPELGMIPPMRFIPVAEVTGLIEPLGDWVLRAACRQAQAWARAGIPPLRMAVNLSARQLRNPGLLSRILELMKDAELGDGCLELEITESMLMRDTETALQTIAEAHAHGIAISIDDFGTGYSSLSYLKRFQVDHLKIDRSFIHGLPRDTDDVSIARAIIAMAKSLGIGVIAEGVETEEQRAFLKSAGCDHMQGYLMSRPLAAIDLEPLLRRNLTGAAVER
jgi:diguanylate cyclase (GGDEF)-like protein/PAS domain S-box-containing protein